MSSNNKQLNEVYKYIQKGIIKVDMRNVLRPDTPYCEKFVDLIKELKEEQERKKKIRKR